MGPECKTDDNRVRAIFGWFASALDRNGWVEFCDFQVGLVLYLPVIKSTVPTVVNSKWQIAL